VAGGDPARGRELVDRMCASMVHRGPDDSGTASLDFSPNITVAAALK